jgi:hypothetical protein
VFMKKYFLLALLCLLSACASSSTTPDPKPGPASALGDSPTITGKIANLSEANLEGKTLTIKAKANANTSAEKIIAEGTVAADGSFSLKLPGEAPLTDSLAPIKVENQQTQCGNTAEFKLSVTPTFYKTTSLPTLELYADGTRVESLLHANGNTLAPPYSEVQYVFVDRDVNIQGVCQIFETGKIIVSQDLRKGWNTVILGPNAEDSNALDSRTAKPDNSFKWLITVCTIGCS